MNGPTLFATDVDWDRIGSNFWFLMEDTLPETFDFAGQFLVSVLLGGALFLIAGFVLGIVAYLLLRRWGCFRCDYDWYRYVGWAWAVLFAISFSLGAGYGGLWFGGGRCVKKHITEHRVIERIVVNLYCAIALDMADTELRDGDRLEAFDNVLADSQALRRLSEKDFKRSVHKTAQARADSWYAKLGALALAKLITDKADDLANEEGVDVRVLVMAVQEPEKIDAYRKEHPNGNLALAAASHHLETIREQAVSLVNSAVYSNLAAGLAAGVGIPAVLLALFRLILWWIERNRKDVSG
ncbi:MAG: hypothetical protein HQ567_17115 [Candidatus Nealsonbacteria bacterium]|nr:hypothetical protein [Candidatus Nealsonbacteria bacterium]